MTHPQLTNVQLPLRNDAEVAVRAYGASIGTSNEKTMSGLADKALRKYFNSFPRKSLIAPKGPRITISTTCSW